MSSFFLDIEIIVKIISEKNYHTYTYYVNMHTRLTIKFVSLFDL